MNQKTNNRMQMLTAMAIFAAGAMYLGDCGVASNRCKRARLLTESTGNTEKSE